MESHYAFEDGSLVEVDNRTPLDDLIEAEERANLDDERVICAEFGKIDPRAILLVLSLLVPQTMRRNSWRIATIRLVCLAHALLPELRRHSTTKVAESLGISKALLSYYTVQLRDAAGLSCAGGKSRTGREVYSERQRRIWRNKKAPI